MHEQKSKLKKIIEIICSVEDIEDHEINFSDTSKDKFDGDLTREALTVKDKISKKVYDEWDLEKQTRLVDILESDEKDDEVLNILKEGEWNFSDELANKILTANLPEGHGSLSEKAILLLLPYLKQGQIYSDAIVSAGLETFDHEIDHTEKLYNYNKHSCYS